MSAVYDHIAWLSCADCMCATMLLTHTSSCVKLCISRSNKALYFHVGGLKKNGVIVSSLKLSVLSSLSVSLQSMMTILKNSLIRDFEMLSC